MTLGRETIWPPAILHLVARGAIKVVVAPEPGVALAVAWMGACATLRFLAFLVPRPRAGREEAACST